MIDNTFVTDCDYCGEISLCVNDAFGGTCCSPCSEAMGDFEDDGQPDEYTEWQDVYGGDDWDQGQYDCEW
jgi:hypothetical protein|tara:strand:+ start:214 stop:423 length:210 start_codon:yes stop_codon:yes gene_type:complete